MTDDSASLTRRISEVYPDLVVSRVAPLAQGQHHTVLIVNDTLVFRFPRYAAGMNDLIREVGILRTLQGRTPIPVPHPIYTSLSPHVVGQVFVGYPFLPGVPLSRVPIPVLSTEGSLQSLARQLGSFLDTLHGTPLETVGIVGVHERVIVHRWQDMYHRIVHRLFPLMRPDTHQRVRNHFEPFLDDAQTRSLVPRLVHGDFGAGNILYDATTRRITGVIDFGSVRADDPAVDLAALSTIHPQLLDVLLDLRPTVYPVGTNMLDRVRFYQGTFALQEALFGLDAGDAEALQAGLSAYTE